MRSEQVTNEADNETIRATRDDNGLIVVEWSPCDSDGHATSFGWVELCRREPDGAVHYADDNEGESWTEDRAFAVNSVLRMV